MVTSKKPIRNGLKVCSEVFLSDISLRIKSFGSKNSTKTTKPNKKGEIWTKDEDEKLINLCEKYDEIL